MDKIGQEIEQLHNRWHEDADKYSKCVIEEVLDRKEKLLAQNKKIEKIRRELYELYQQESNKFRLIEKEYYRLTSVCGDLVSSTEKLLDQDMRHKFLSVQPGQTISFPRAKNFFSVYDLEYQQSPVFDQRTPCRCDLDCWGGAHYEGKSGEFVYTNDRKVDGYRKFPLEEYDKKYIITCKKSWYDREGSIPHTSIFYDVTLTRLSSEQ